MSCLQIQDKFLPQMFGFIAFYAIFITKVEVLKFGIFEIYWIAYLEYHSVLIIYICTFLGALIIFADHFAFNDC